MYIHNTGSTHINLSDLIRNIMLSLFRNSNVVFYVGKSKKKNVRRCPTVFFLLPYQSCSTILYII